MHSPAFILDCNQWRHAQDLDGRCEGSSHIFAGITSPLQSVQRAEHCVVILALQVFSGVLIGIDNLNVLRGVAKVIYSGTTGTPLSLVKDGDLLAVIHSMLSLRGEGTVRVSKVKGHALLRPWLTLVMLDMRTLSATMEPIRRQIQAD